MAPTWFRGTVDSIGPRKRTSCTPTRPLITASLTIEWVLSEPLVEIATKRRQEWTAVRSCVVAEAITRGGCWSERNVIASSTGVVSSNVKLASTLWTSKLANNFLLTFEINLARF